MSLYIAFDCIKSELSIEVPPPKINKRSSPVEYSTKNFSIWKVKDINKLKHIVERRLKMSSGYKIEHWLRDQYEFIKSLSDDEVDSLWQAYWINNGKRTEFLINIKSKRFIKAITM